MTEVETVDLVRRAFSAAFAADWPTLRGLFHEDFSWTLPGRSRIAGVVTGVDGFMEKFAVVRQAGIEVELLDTLGSETRVATLQRNHAPGDPGLDITVVNLFTIADGKIASMQTFPSDLYELERFYGPPR